MFWTMVIWSNKALKILQMLRLLIFYKTELGTVGVCNWLFVNNSVKLY